MKKIYTTPSLKEIALRCDGMLMDPSDPTEIPVNSSEETDQTLSKDDDINGIFGW